MSAAWLLALHGCWCLPTWALHDESFCSEINSQRSVNWFIVSVLKVRRTCHQIYLFFHLLSSSFTAFCTNWRQCTTAAQTDLLSPSRSTLSLPPWTQSHTKVVKNDKSSAKIGGWSQTSRSVPKVLNLVGGLARRYEEELAVPVNRLLYIINVILASSHKRVQEDKFTPPPPQSLRLEWGWPVSE